MKRAFLIWVTVCLLALPTLGTAATLSGVVIEDESGAPLDASLLLYKRNATGGFEFTAAEGTDASGNYSFNYLEAGTYFLECEAYADCDPEAEYCADKYLPQLYDGVQAWDFGHKKNIVLASGSAKVLNPIRIKARPFYFETMPIDPVVIPDSGGTVKITATVINTTKNILGMLFWGEMEPPCRADHSKFYDLWSLYPFAQHTWKVIRPGANKVILTCSLGALAPEGLYYYLVFGGGGYVSPKMPPLEGFFCKGVSAHECTTDLAVAGRHGGSARAVRSNRNIATRFSEDGKVLETGPRKK